MKLWLFLIGALIVQEPVSSNAALLLAYQHHYNLWLVHLIFVLATTFDILVGYVLGKWVNRHFGNSAAIRYAKRWLGTFTKFAGKNGQRISIFLFGSIIFPAPAFLAPWLDLPFWEIFVCLFLGDLVLWYGFEWLVVLGVKTFVVNPQLALYFAIGISFAVAM